MNVKARLSIVREIDTDRACWMHLINRNAGSWHAKELKTFNNVRSERIIADAAHDQRVRAERAGMTGEVRGRSAHLSACREQVPKDLAYSDDFELFAVGIIVRKIGGVHWLLIELEGRSLKPGNRPHF